MQTTENRTEPGLLEIELELIENCILVHSDWEYARNISGILYCSESEEISRDY